MYAIEWKLKKGNSPSFKVWMDDRRKFGCINNCSVRSVSWWWKRKTGNENAYDFILSTPLFFSLQSFLFTFYSFSFSASTSSSSFPCMFFCVEKNHMPNGILWVSRSTTNYFHWVYSANNKKCSSNSWIVKDTEIEREAGKNLWI